MYPGQKTAADSAQGPASRREARALFDTSAMISLRERERVRLGYDLHDGPAQTMSAALLQIRMLEDSAGDDLRSGLREVRETIARAVAEVYSIIDGLDGNRSPGIDLVAHIRALTTDLAQLTGMEAEMTVEGQRNEVPSPVQIVLFRIVQEALSNVRRHASASTVHVRLAFGADDVVCEIEDDGIGFDPSAPVTARYGREPYGLASMLERSAMLDGDCRIDTAPGCGTRVTVRMPL